MQENAMERRALRSLRGLAGVIVPVVAVILATGASLRMLNHIPELIQPGQGNLATYPNIKQAERALRIRIILPAYLPDYLARQPYSIKSEKKPKLKVTLQFAYRDNNLQALIIEEGFPAEGKELESPSPPKARSTGSPQGWRSKNITINGSPIEMLSWIDEDGLTWHRAIWVTRGRRLEARSVLPEEEFLRIIGSVSK